ncbi:MAG: hypothetical protein P4L41_03720 [Flavipsychrobacter sp.]|nr:hypothetical protein [Flavipsychrobacter sp.]
MKKRPIIYLLAFLAASCTKNTASLTPIDQGGLVTPFKPTGFFFGEYEYSHLSNNFVTWPFYYTDSNKVTKQYRAESSMVYTTPQPIADSAYTIIKPLIDGFPAYLALHPDTSFGCPNCVNERVLEIVSITGTDTTRWSINTDTTTMPTDVKPYAAKMLQALNQLKKL